MFNTRIITCSLAAAGVLCIGSQAPAQNPVINPNSSVAGILAALAAANGTPVAFRIGGGPFSLDNQLSVPVGQRFVIEYASGKCSIGAPAPPWLEVFTNGLQNNHYFTVPNFNVQAFINTPFGQSVKIYADPGSTITMGGSSTHCIMTLSGRLVTP